MTFSVLSGPVNKAVVVAVVTNGAAALARSSASQTVQLESLWTGRTTPPSFLHLAGHYSRPVICT